MKRKVLKSKPIVYAFIDSQNLNLAIRNQGWKLDFKKFRRYLKEKYNTKKAYLFIGYVAGNELLYKKLQEDGFILVLKPTLVFPDGTVKGNVDAELVLHTMIEFSTYDHAVVVTGDGDFHCLVNYLNRNDKLLKLLIPNSRRYSSLLKPFAPNKIDFMNNLRDKLASKKKVLGGVRKVKQKKERQLHKD